MTTLQTVLISVSGGFSLLSILFLVMFVIEISCVAKEKIAEPEVKSIFSSENYSSEPKTSSVDEMLAKLNKVADEQVVNNVSVTIVENKEVEKPEEKPEIVEQPEEKQEIEVINQTVIPVQDVEISNVEKTNKSEVFEETTEETYTEEVHTVVNNAVSNNEKSAVSNGVKISNSDLIDYKSRLEEVVQSKDKLSKDLVKIEKSILNYERTKRRKIRNQKMLDRRASELTNLNLIMYSVTDIKNIDEDKKAKQEELTNHIAELKASIQDADEFLENNKEKNEHDVKMAKFLIQEKARFNDEISSLQKLISKTTGNATVA